ncbi:MAG: hypothetical protein ACI9WU_003636 [Myxococcota bacterium]|jgi:hypothetical protein
MALFAFTLLLFALLHLPPLRRRLAWSSRDAAARTPLALPV